MKIDPFKFWHYSYSNFIENANRGALAEYIVASALGVSKSPFSSWESYDLESHSGIKIEVKASGYLQAWHQNRESMPTFGIGKKQGWDSEKNDFDRVLSRHADVYVFCLHHERGIKPSMNATEQVELKQRTNPLDTMHWTFWVVPTGLINSKLTNQKSIRISTIEKVLNISAIGYEAISQEIARIEALHRKS